MGRDTGKKIKAGKVPGSNSIPDQKPPPAPQLRFSFKHVQLTHKKFHLGGVGTGYAHRFVEVMKDLSCRKWSEIVSHRSYCDIMRFHQIDFDGTSELGGFQLKDEQLLQAALAIQFVRA